MRFWHLLLILAVAGCSSSSSAPADSGGLAGAADATVDLGRTPADAVYDDQPRPPETSSPDVAEVDLLDALDSGADVTEVVQPLDTVDDESGGIACDEEEACYGDTCTNPIPITGPGQFVASAAGKTDNFASSCGEGTGNDLVFAFVLSSDADVSINTQGSDFDTVVAVRASCGEAYELQCNDDVDFRHDWSRVDLNDLAAGTYFVIVDTNGPAGASVVLNVAVSDWELPPAVALDDDPLVRMPGTQHDSGIELEESQGCLVCHGGPAGDGVEIGHRWSGSMMAQASRDFLFLASMTVALQDSRWVLGSMNAGDLCLRCHFPAGWVAGRSSPSNGTAMVGADFDGITCDTCHRQFDPHFVATHEGEREGADWLNVWDETNLSETASAAAAESTFLADAVESAKLLLFNGEPAFGVDDRPVEAGWTEAASGQYFIAADNAKRASFADADSTHEIQYSRFHKSRYLCASCHDVSNPVLANLEMKGVSPGDGSAPLPTESLSAYSYEPVERTFSEFMLSKFGQNGGAEGSASFAPSVFETSLPGNKIGRCQDCHMPDVTGKGSVLAWTSLRPDESTEHPQSGMPAHDLVGGNVFVSTVLASTDPKSPNYDSVNAELLGQGPDVLTLDLSAGAGINGKLLLAGAARAKDFLERAATIEEVAYSKATGTASFKVFNHTGHKLTSGFAEGRRMFLNVRLYDDNELLREINPYDSEVGTLKGLPHEYSISSPTLGAGEEYIPELVYEMHHASSLTNEDETFHFILGTSIWKDNRIPPAGFNISNAPERHAEPYWQGTVMTDYFTTEEYAGGFDQVTLSLPQGGNRLEVRLYYQTTSREYVEFVRDEINGNSSTLSTPTPSGAAIAYVAQQDSFFNGLKAWGETIWSLWSHNQNVPGAAPYLMVEAIEDF
jgi:hypothetical protein